MAWIKLGESKWLCPETGMMIDDNPRGNHLDMESIDGSYQSFDKDERDALLRWLSKAEDVTEATEATPAPAETPAATVTPVVTLTAEQVTAIEEIRDVLRRFDASGEDFVADWMADNRVRIGKTFEIIAGILEVA